MKLVTLISTMNQSGYDLLERMNIQSDAIVINQCAESSSKFIRIRESNIVWFNSMTRGLSISRNMALRKATADICILSDDDLVYISNYEEIIIEQFRLYPMADIIVFQVEGIEQKFKNYSSKPKKINYLESMRVSSVEIAFKLDSLVQSGIKFNEMFGSGAKFFSGEESIFLFDCLKKGLKIQYVPIKIADLHIGNSTWFKGYNTDYFIAKGAAFTAMSQMFSIILILQFALRKYKLYRNEKSMLEAIRLMLDGRKQFLNSNE